MTLTPSALPPSPGIVRISPFAALVSRFDELIATSSSMVLYFIHSRRWLENHATAIKGFMAKAETTLEVFLPDLENHELMFSLETMLGIAGDLDFADHLERIAFNALPPQATEDYRHRQYFQSANQVLCTRARRNFYEED